MKLTEAQRIAIEGITTASTASDIRTMFANARAEGSAQEITFTADCTIDPDAYEVVFFDTTLGAIAAGLAASTQPRHMIFIMSVDGGTDVTLTPAVLGDYSGGAVTDITFNDAGDTAQLYCDGTTWYVIGTATATVA